MIRVRQCLLCDVKINISKLFCDSCFAVVQVGKMIHKLPIGYELLHDDDNLWYVINDKQGDTLGGCHTPLEILEIAVSTGIIAND